MTRREFLKLVLRECLLSLLLLVLIAFAMSGGAGTTNLITYTFINGTNNGAAFIVPGIIIPQKSFLIQTGNITNAPVYVTNNGITYNLATNSIVYNLQLSIDPNNSNWVTIATFNPYGTNGEVDSFSPSFVTTSLPMRLQAVTTNPIPAATFLTQ